MNIYVVTEDEVGGKKIYQSWIPFINPNLKLVDSPTEFNENNFLIYTANGYPAIFDLIDSAIEDINALGNIDRLVIGVDSENLERNVRYTEVQDYVAGKYCRAEIIIVVQHFCIETWALGNKKLIRRNIQNRQLAFYKRYFDTSRENPELMPNYPDENLNRAQFAYKYLHLAVNDLNNRFTYTKHNPSIVVEKTYFEQVLKRSQETNHISSFVDFLSAFR